MLAKKTCVGLALLGCLTGPLYGDVQQDIDQLEKIVAYQKQRIDNLRERLERLRGPNGEIRANGITVIDTTRTWVGPLQGLRGPKGDRGPAGDDGKNGKDGLAGATGPEGAQGDQGPKGKPGTEVGAKGPKGATGPRGDLGDPPKQCR